VNKSRSKRYTTAVHEAGHVVIGRVLDLPCGSATIVPDRKRGTLGSAEVDTSEDAWFRWIDRGKERPLYVLLRATIIVDMAGWEAEKELLGATSDGYAGDNESALFASMEMSDVASDPEQKKLRQLRRQTGWLVRKHREKIQRMADALMKRRTLSADEIDSLFKATTSK
jgi:ATP-dependent Zn protease